MAERKTWQPLNDVARRREESLATVEPRIAFIGTRPGPDWIWRMFLEPEARAWEVRTMSTGLVICSVCRREVHQDGPPLASDPAGRATWRHCDRGTALCIGATVRYPASAGEIVGMWCGVDDLAGKFDESRQARERLAKKAPLERDNVENPPILRAKRVIFRRGRFVQVDK